MAHTHLMDARLLTRTLADPAYALTLDDAGWTALLTIAHAERLSGSLAHRLAGLAVPAKAAEALAAATVTAETGRTQALWEAEMARRALAELAVPIILLKGTAFVAAGLDAGRGRFIGDLDILVPRASLDAVEAALLGAGWEWVKPDPYDDAYYRQHMHELPPLIHRERDRMIDVHHTILPLTARVTPDADALIKDAMPLGNGLHIFGPADMLLHAVAHLFADGDLAGGLRNLWDIDRLIREQADAPGYWEALDTRAKLHGLRPHLACALRMARHLYETPVDATLAGNPALTDIAYMSRLLARNGWGQESRWILRQAFYIRSHWLRMPPLMLARHLWVKWRRG
ncbi:MAG: nucleotidyltransferase family protein [Sphingomonadaceae bacterium]